MKSLLLRYGIALFGCAVWAAPSGSVVAREQLHQLAMHDMMPMQQTGAMGMDDDGPMGMRGGSQQTPGATQPSAASPAVPPAQPMPGSMGKSPAAQQQPDGVMPMSGMRNMEMGRRGMSMEGASTMPMTDDMSRMMMRAGPRTSLDRIEGRLAFLRTELHITDQQSPAWDEFAQALRNARQHLVDARGALQIAGHSDHSPVERVEAYVRHLKERLAAVNSAGGAFLKLYNMLDDARKRTAAELVVPTLESF